MEGNEFNREILLEFIQNVNIQSANGLSVAKIGYIVQEFGNNFFFLINFFN